MKKSKRSKSKNKTNKKILKTKEAPIEKEEPTVIETPPCSIPTDDSIDSRFVLTVSTNGSDYEIATNDLVESLLTLKLEKITNKVLVKVETEGKIAERWLYPFRARRLFTNRMFAEIFCKQLVMFFK